jgi:hypothetical protein
MKVKKGIVKTLAAFALICGLSLSARAQLGNGWTPDNETYFIQTSAGCNVTTISGGYQFSIPSGHGRAEQCGNNLPTNTTNQWQGFCTIVSYPAAADEICCHQVFGPPPSTPDLILDIKHYGGGLELNNFLQGEEFLTTVQVGVQFQMNTIYDPVGNLISIYVNSSEVGTEVPNAGIHYNKYGAYAQESGGGPATYNWVGVQSWANGTAPSNAGVYLISATISNANSGYMTPEGNVSVNAGASQTFTITPLAGFAIAGVSVDGKGVGAVASYTFTNVQSNHTISVTFKTGSGGTTVATPTFSPAAGTYSSAQSVAISDGTSGATIYYTTNGSTPTTSSTVYSGAIPVSTTTTIEALAAASGDTNSAVASATYTINPVQQQVATPTFSPASGTYTSAQSVSLSDSTSGATIYYTTNGSTPTTSSAVYSGAIPVSSGTLTIEALGAASGDTNSNVASAIYTINPVQQQVATPTFSPASGTYTSAQTVTISDSTGGASIYYTTNGTTPTPSSTVYSGPIPVSSTTTLEAIGAESGFTNSNVGSATYTIGSSTGGCVTATSGGSYQNSSMTAQTGTFTATCDATPTASPTNAVVALSNGAQTAYANFACLARFNPSGDIDARNGGAYAAASTIPYSANVSYHFRLVVNVSAQTYSIYVTPAGGSELTVGLNYAFRASATTLNNWAVYVDSGSGGAGSVTVCNFSTGTPPPPQVATPTFSPAGGTYTSAQNVSLSDSTGGATIYYTTNGSTPTTSSTVYSGPIPVSSGTVTIEAIGAASGDTNSNVASATYTIAVVQQQVATPTFSPAGGTYTSAQNVSLSDSTGGATIYYTTNGSTPTTSSTVYSGPIPVSSGTVTIEAIGAASGDTNSNVGSATYTISTTSTCVTATMGGSYKNSSMPAQTGTFTFTCDATPTASPTNSVVALSNGAQTAYANFACLARFNPSGDIDARNGGAYAAASTIPYSANVSYHFRLVVNVSAQTYSIYVTPAGGSELTVGTNYAFRISDTTLNNWAVYVDSGSGGAGSVTVCNASP